MRSEFTLAALCNELQQNFGDELAAARTVGVSLVFVNQWAKDDPKVKEALAEAARVGTQGLYTAAVQRGVVGVEEDVYYKGVVVGQKVNYSDSLLGKLMEAKLPEFRKGADASAPSVTVNIANVMPRANNYQEWLAMKQQTLAAPTTDAVDVEVQDITDAEPVRNPFEGVNL